MFGGGSGFVAARGLGGSAAGGGGAGLDRADLGGFLGVRIGGNRLLHALVGGQRFVGVEAVVAAFDGASTTGLTIGRLRTEVDSTHSDPV